MILGRSWRWWGLLAAKSFLSAVFWALLWLWAGQPAMHGARLLASKQLGDVALGLLIFVIGFCVLPGLGLALTWLVIADQRLRCRVCVRRLVMPVASGRLSALILDHPATEYICPYGHGKLKTEIWVTGEPQDWTQYGDMWDELLEASRDDKWRRGGK